MARSQELHGHVLCTYMEVFACMLTICSDASVISACLYFLMCFVHSSQESVCMGLTRIPPPWIHVCVRACECVHKSVEYIQHINTFLLPNVIVINHDAIA